MATGAFMPRKSALDAVIAMDGVSEEAKQVAEMLRDGEFRAFPMSSYVNEYLTEISTYMTEALAGNMTVEDAARPLWKRCSPWRTRPPAEQTKETVKNRGKRRLCGYPARSALSFFVSRLYSQSPCRGPSLRKRGFGMRNASAAKKEGNGIKKRKSKQERRFFLLGLLFVSPWLIGFLCFQLYPILSALYYSFTDFNIFQPAEFTGLDQLCHAVQRQIFSGVDQEHRRHVLHRHAHRPCGRSGRWPCCCRRRSRACPRSAPSIILPTVVPIVASAMLFLWVLNPEYGLLNNFLSWFGIRGPSWLSDPKFTKISLMIMDVWRCGQNTVIFLSALKAVPKSFYEAAELDGAGPVKRFFKITLPYISPTIQFLVVMGLISSFQYFTQAYVFASVSQVGQSITGGPQNSLLFYSMYLYMNGFSYMKMGYASAMAIVLFLIVLVVSFVAMYLMEKRVTYDVE